MIQDRNDSTFPSQKLYGKHRRLASIYDNADFDLFRICEQWTTAGVASGVQQQIWCWTDDNSISIKYHDKSGSRPYNVGQRRRLLSEAVRRLETQLGVRLLHRTTRSVTPTEVGIRPIKRLRLALGEV